MSNLWGNPFKALGTNDKMSLISGLGTAAGNMAGQAISSGFSSTGGSVLNGLGDITGMIPGPWGAAISGGLKIIGGLIDRAFGAKMNEENINKVQSDIASLQSFKSNATDFDTLSSNWSNADMGTDFSNSYIGKDGWFSTKAKDKANELREQLEEGRNRATRALAHNADNIASAQVSNLLGNYSAYGGPLLFADGGGIHIKPSKRGTFTATAKKHGKGVQEFARQVLANKENYSSAMVKKANFARNAAKFKHSEGGSLNPYSAESLVDAIYSTFKGEQFLGKPSHNYDFTISKDSSSKKLNNSYNEGEIYDVTEEEVKILKELGYEFEYM